MNYHLGFSYQSNLRRIFAAFYKSEAKPQVLEIVYKKICNIFRKKKCTASLHTHWFYAPFFYEEPKYFSCILSYNYNILSFLRKIRWCFCLDCENNKLFFLFFWMKIN